MSMETYSSKKEDNPQLQVYHSIKPGQTWLDTNGKPIQAHGFSVFYNDGVYYWYGENKEFTTQGSKVWTYGIRCYTSTDFYNWDDRGLIIMPDTTDVLSPIHPSQWLDRPHIIYCAKTQKYVAWIKNLGVGAGALTVMQADDFMGPYQLISYGVRPAGYEFGDFDLYVDKVTGKAYVWFERPHWEMICAELNDDFTGVTDKLSHHMEGRIPPLTREAPAHFMHDGRHYLYTSGTSGFYPNESLVTVFDDYQDEYTDLGNPHPDDVTHTSYYSQITDVIKIPGKKDLYVALADRWYSDSTQVEVSQREWARIGKLFAGHKPAPRNTECVGMKDMTSISRNGWDVTCKGTYVWLPITWEDGIPKLYWRDEWSLDEFE